MVLETERLLLRRFKSDDLMDFYEYCKNPNVGPNAGWLPHANIDISKVILDEFINDMKTGENGELVFTLNDEQYYLVYLPVGFEDWVLASMVPPKVADSNIADIQKMTVVMAAHISVLLLMIAVIVLYTY